MKTRLVVVGVFVAWSAAHLDGFSWDYDEGIHVYIAWLVQHGHALYTQTFSPYTPGLIAALVAAFDVFGPSVYVARMVTVLLAAFGMLGVMLLARDLVPPEPAPAGGVRGRTLRALGGGPGNALIAGLFAAVLLALTPAFLEWSRAAMSDLPAAALMALALAFALGYLRTGHLRWLFAAEIVAMGALWIKLIALGGGLALAIVLLLALRREARKRVLLGTLLIALLSLAPLLLFDVRALFEQAIYFHIEKRAAYADQTTLDRLSILLDFLGANMALTVLAALGALASLIDRATRQASLVVCVWFAATFISLVAQAPLFANHHPVVLVFPLAALAGAGVAVAAHELRLTLSALPRQGTPPDTTAGSGVSARHVAGVSLCAAALLIAALSLAGLDERLRAVLAPPFQPVAEEAVALLDALTPTDDLLASDAQMIAFRAQRQAPPALSDTSQARILSGSLTADGLVALLRTSQPNALLFWSGRLDSLTPFVEWAEGNYHRVQSSMQKPNSPYRLLLREAHPQIALDARFGDGIHLLGYDVNRRDGDPVRAGLPLALTLYFERTGAAQPSYTIFVHLLGPDGRLLAQDDHLPLAGRYPTDRWSADEFIVDEFVLPLDVETPEGEYALELGLYQSQTLQRAPAFVGGTRQSDDRVLLRSVHVSAGKS